MQKRVSPLNLVGIGTKTRFRGTTQFLSTLMPKQITLIIT